MIFRGLRELCDVKLGWVAITIGLEGVSMLAFALQQRTLLAASRSRMTLRWLLYTAYEADAVATFVPLVGSGLATSYVYRYYRLRDVDPTVTGVTLTASGVVSTVALVAVAAAAGVLSGDLAAR